MSVRGWQSWLTAHTLAILGLIVFFSLYPETDLAVAAHFYRADGGFFLGKNPLVLLPYRGIPWLMKLFGTAAVLVLVANLHRKRQWLGLTPRVFIYLALVLALGPGLLVNGILKEHSGRARPIQVEQFGGTRQYTPPFMVADQCEHNCSFASGHAASGFFFVALALLARQRRGMWISFALLAGTLTGLGRMAQGGHFLSDVLFGGLLTTLIALLLYGIVFRERLTRPGL